MQAFLPILIFLFPLAYSPGPGNLFFAANGARFGFRATLPATFGYHLATLVVTLALGFGLLAAIESAPLLFPILKMAGAAYVLWLAWCLFRAGALDAAAIARPANALDGAVLLVLNPKAYVIIALLFTQFLAPSDTSSWATVTFISVVFTLNNFIAFTVWTVIGDRIARVFRSDTAAHRLNMALGLMLAGVAAWMALA